MTMPMDHHMQSPISEYISHVGLLTSAIVPINDLLLVIVLCTLFFVLVRLEFSDAKRIIRRFDFLYTWQSSLKLLTYKSNPRAPPAL